MADFRLLLDTHIFLWLMLGSKDLGNREALEESSSRGNLFVSPITCWEVGMLASRGRVSLSLPCHDWMAQALKAPGLSLLPLSAEAAVEASFLPGKFHGDPADRMLVASARAHTLRLATRDQKILDYGESGMVQVLPC